MPWILNCQDERFRHMAPVDPSAWVTDLDSLRAVQRTREWRKLAVRLLGEGDSGEVLPAADFVHLSAWLPVLSRRALEVLADLLENCGEALPVDCDEGEYFVLHIGRCVAALDLEQSTLVRYSSARAMFIRKHVFSEPDARLPAVFRMPYVEPSLPYVTAAFVDRVRAAGLRGAAIQTELFSPAEAIG